MPRGWLSLETVEAFIPMARDRGVSEVARSRAGFVSAYRRAGGDPAALPEEWRRKRDGFVARHMAQVQEQGESLVDADGSPSRRHLALIMWAYSPEGARVTKRAARENPRPKKLPLDFPFAKGEEDGIWFETGVPVRFPYTHRVQPTPNFGSLYGQDIEPAGKYVLLGHHGPSGFFREAGWNIVVQQDEAALESPLVMRFGEGTRDWKEHLVRAVGATGKRLAKALRKAGFDGVVTLDELGTREIVLLPRENPEEPSSLCRIPLSEAQAFAVDLYVFDPAIAEYEELYPQQFEPDELKPASFQRVGNAVVFNAAEREDVRRYLANKANGADEYVEHARKYGNREDVPVDMWRQVRDSLQALNRKARDAVAR